MGMRQHDRVETPYSPRKQVRRNDILPDRKCAVVSQIQESARGNSPAIDERPASVREFDERRIALADVYKRQCNVLWWSRRKVS